MTLIIFNFEKISVTGNKKRIEFNDFIKNEPAVFKFAYMTGGGM